jgi:iron complex outermembrane receptor protein
MRVSSGRPYLAALLASSALVAAPALAQDATPPQESAAADAAPAYGEIVVTAQKRSESLQNVPISIQALGTQKLQDLNISDFKGYVQQLPTVTFQALGGNPGTNVVYMRGVVSGGDGNHSGSLPSVGVYLDEQPVTTIGGNLDVHIYDIARIESLSGPQGTLYGASSEAGTIRIITNKPDFSGFYGSIDVEGNTVNHGGQGGKVEGMLNLPISPRAALRVVGFYQRDAGFIDNVLGSRTFVDPNAGNDSNEAVAALDAVPNTYQPGQPISNAAFVKNDYNDTETYGGRAALRVELDDNWTVTPSVIYQEAKSHGSYAFDPSLGDLVVQHFFPENRSDKFIQAALTIEGKLGNWDLTYAGAYLDRKAYQSSDYTDYSEAYDAIYASAGGLAGYFYYKDALGNQVDPRQRVISTDHFKKFSQEFRIASPSTERFRIITGLFYQYQSNDIHQDYQIAGLAPELSVNGLPGTVWLTEQHRIDRDYAMFGEASFDVTSKFTVTAGVRGFIYDNSLVGFFGFGRNPAEGYSTSPPNAAGSTRTGVAQCFTTAGDRVYDRDSDSYSSSLELLPPVVPGSPCTNLGRYVAGVGVVPVKTSGQGVTYRFNGTWKPVDGLMVYATFSRGFRPGGLNRRGTIPPYAPDFLKNYEIGVKTKLWGGKLRINAAVYQQEWAKFQFAFLGANSFTEIHNGPDARIRGVEMDATLNAGPLTVNVAGAYTDAKTKGNLCRFDDPTPDCSAVEDNSITAPVGTRLPVTPQWKASGTARYSVPVGTATAYGQVNASYQSSATADLRLADAADLGILKEFATVNLAFGVDWEKYRIEAFVSNVFDVKGELTRFEQCGGFAQRPYIVPTTPRTIGLRIGADF